MLSHKGLRKAEKVLPAVVIDIGYCYTRLGIAGEHEPRAIIPTTVQDIGGPTVYLFKHDNSREVAHVKTEDNQQNLRKFFNKIYYKTLNVQPSGQGVIICESLFNPTKIRQDIATMLFEKFEIPSLMFAPHHLLSCFTVATGTAMVLDCSYSETLAVPVVEGTTILWAWQAASLGGGLIHEALQKEITENGKMKVNHLPPQPVNVTIAEKVLEDIKVKACFVSEYERSKRINQATENMNSKTMVNPPPNMTYPLDSSTLLIIPGAAREKAPEVLFEQDDDGASVATLLLDSLMLAPIDSRKELGKNLLVTGGTTLLPGFKQRLLYEIKELIKSEERYKKLSEIEFRVHDPPVPAHLVSWLGASIFASLDIFQQRSVSHYYFEQHGKKIPDWCIYGLPPPEKVPKPPTPTLSKKMRGFSLSTPARLNRLAGSAHS